MSKRTPYLIYLSRNLSQNYVIRKKQNFPRFRILNNQINPEKRILLNNREVMELMGDINFRNNIYYPKIRSSTQYGSSRGFLPPVQKSKSTSNFKKNNDSEKNTLANCDGKVIYKGYANVRNMGKAYTEIGIQEKKLFIKIESTFTQKNLPKEYYYIVFENTNGINELKAKYSTYKKILNQLVYQKAIDLVTFDDIDFLYKLFKSKFDYLSFFAKGYHNINNISKKEINENKKTAIHNSKIEKQEEEFHINYCINNWLVDDVREEIMAYES